MFMETKFREKLHYFSCREFEKLSYRDFLGIVQYSLKNCRKSLFVIFLTASIIFC